MTDKLLSNEEAEAIRQATQQELLFELGFSIEPAELIEDITIRPSDESESTSATVWSRSAPTMTAVMLVDLWKALVCERKRTHALLSDRSARIDRERKLVEALERAVYQLEFHAKIALDHQIIKESRALISEAL